MIQAVILAGGKGTRLAERLQGRPKPLVPVGGVPLLERQIEALARHGVDDIVVLVNHAADQIESFFRQRSPSVPVRLVDDGEPRGTAGAVLACLDLLADRFVVVYGDTLFDLDVTHMLDWHCRSAAAVTLMLHPNDHPADSDLVELDDAGRVTRFHGYPHPDGVDLRNLVNAAFYIVEKSALEPWRTMKPPCDFAKDLFPRMVEAGVHIEGYVSFEYIKDLGTPRRLDKVEHHLATGVVERASRRRAQRAVFLDRDGTLNRLCDYVRHPDELIMLSGAAEAVKKFNNAEFRVVVVTNQPVVARGECSFETLRAIHNRLESRLGEKGAYIDGLYFCPHHPHRGFPGEVVALKQVCKCRKPEIGMIQEAASSMRIDLSASWMIGDSTSDMLAAQRAGLRSVLVRTGESGQDGKYLAQADFVCPDLTAAAHLIVDLYPRLAHALQGLVAHLRPGDLVLVESEGAPTSHSSMLAGVLKAELTRRGESVAVVSSAPTEASAHPKRASDGWEAEILPLASWLDGGGADLNLPIGPALDTAATVPAHIAPEAIVIVLLRRIPAAGWRTSRRICRIRMDARGAAVALQEGAVPWQDDVSPGCGESGVPGDASLALLNFGPIFEESDS